MSTSGTSTDGPRFTIDLVPRATAALAAVLLVAAAVGIAAIAQDGDRPDRLGEAGLDGRTAILYATETAARDACPSERVVLADQRRRLFFPPDAPNAGSGAALPDRGFGCETDLRTNHFTAAS